MFRVLTCLTGEHDLRLVVLAGLVCFLASYAAINLFNRARATARRARAVWVTCAGLATGFGIWSTHFIAMLAYEPGVPIAYDVVLTTFSLVAAASVTTAGLAIAVYSGGRFSAPLGGAVIGGGVACMHYLGMWAVEVPGRVTWAFELVAASIVVGMLLAAFGLHLAVRGEDMRRSLAAAGLVTLAIVLHHFTAMGAVEIVPDPTRLVAAFSLSPTTLAFAVAGVAAAVLGISLTGAVSDRRLAARAHQFAEAKRALIRDSEEALRQQNMLLDAAVNNMNQALLLFDADGRLLLCNQRYYEMYGLSEEEGRPGRSLRELLERRRALGTFVGDIDGHLAEHRAAVAQGRTKSYIRECPDGRIISVTNKPKVGGGWVSTHEDITERRRAEMQIAHLAHHDPLTDLPNRAAFTERLASTLQRAAATQESFALLSLDCDRFKEVNDVFGHATGDALLRAIAARLTAPADGAFVARLGGDEFTLITTDPHQPAGAAVLAERLQATLANPIEVHGHQLRIAFTVGIAIYPADGDSESALLANADAALYRAKNEGRGSIRFFEPDMDMRLRERRALQQDLRSAIERNPLELHYQPQGRLGGDIIGFEALVRWRHAQHGMVPPSTFIPLAEESGLIIQLGEWVLRQAIAEAASWPSALQIAVNLSPVQFQHGDLPTL